MKLADEWRQAWKWLNVQLGAVIAVAPLIYEQTKEIFNGMLSPTAFNHVMSLMGVLVILNTVKKKNPPQ